MLGQIKRIVRDKGFGFVASEDGIDRFFHQSAVSRNDSFDEMSEGDAVSFEDDRSPKGPRAKNVNRV